MASYCLLFQILIIRIISLSFLFKVPRKISDSYCCPMFQVDHEFTCFYVKWLRFSTRADRTPTSKQLVITRYQPQNTPIWLAGETNARLWLVRESGRSDGSDWLILFVTVLWLVGGYPYWAGTWLVGWLAPNENRCLWLEARRVRRSWLVICLS